jgi:hypothetical protein
MTMTIYSQFEIIVSEEVLKYGFQKPKWGI